MTAPTIDTLTPAQRTEAERIRATRDRWAEQITAEVNAAPPVSAETLDRLVAVVRRSGVRA